MKQVLITGLLLVAMIQTFALGNAPKDEDWSKVIKRSIDYPEFAKKDKLEGMVMVKFIVNAEGNVSVASINASHDHLATYVTEKLESLRFSDLNAIGEHYVKFNFRFVEI